MAQWLAQARPQVAALLAQAASLPSADTSAMSRMFTFSLVDGPKRFVLDSSTSAMLNDLVRATPTDFFVHDTLQSSETAGQSSLPPTPWCDSEFRELLTEMLLVSGPGASTWSLQWDNGLTTTAASADCSASAWEESALLGMGLDFTHGAPTFEAIIICLAYPRAEGSSSVDLTSQLAIVSTIHLDMEWRNVASFTQYPMARDLLSTVTSSYGGPWSLLSTTSAGAGESPSALPDASDLLVTLMQSAGAIPFGQTVTASWMESTATSSNSLPSSSDFTLKSSAHANDASSPRDWTSSLSTGSTRALHLSGDVVDFELPGLGQSSSMLLRPGKSLEEGSSSKEASLPSIHRLAADVGAGDRASDAGSSSALAGEAASIGWQRLRTEDSDSRLLVEGLVDLSMLASERLCLSEAPPVAAWGEYLVGNAPSASGQGALPASQDRAVALDVALIDSALGDSISWYTPACLDVPSAKASGQNAEDHSQSRLLQPGRRQVVPSADVWEDAPVAASEPDKSLLLRAARALGCLAMGLAVWGTQSSGTLTEDRSPPFRDLAMPRRTS